MSEVLIIWWIILRAVKLLKLSLEAVDLPYFWIPSKTLTLKLEQPACVWFTGTHAVFLLPHLLKQFLGAGMDLDHTRTQLATVLQIAKTFHPQIWVYLIYSYSTSILGALQNKSQPYGIQKLASEGRMHNVSKEVKNASALFYLTWRLISHMTVEH